MEEEIKKFIDEYNELCKKHGLTLRPRLVPQLDIIKLEPEKAELKPEPETESV